MRFVYKLTSPNYKVYIGQTVNLGSRLTDYKRLSFPSQRLIHNSIKKYGWENFKIEILYFGKCYQSEINAIEEYYIKKYKDLNRSLNLADKANLPLVKKGKFAHNAQNVFQCDLSGNIIRKWGCMMDIERELCIIRANVSHAIHNNYFACGFLWCKSLEYDKIKIVKTYNSIATPGDYSKRKIKQINKNFEIIQIFESISSASKELNINKGNIDSCLANKRHTASGFYWLYEEESIEDLKAKNKISKNSKEIEAIDIESGEILKFNSITDASKILNIDRSTIILILKNKTKNPRKYDFKYK